MAAIPTPQRLVRAVLDQAGAGVRLAREQAEAVAALPAALVSLTRAVGSLDAPVGFREEAALDRMGDEAEHPAERLDGRHAAL